GMEAGVSSAAAYSFGGDNDNLSGDYNIIQRLVFSGESTSTISATISDAAFSTAGTYSTTNGYRMGGDAVHGASTIIDRLAFATEVRTTLAAVLTQNYLGASGASSSTKGYIAGGAGAVTTRINSLLFSNETVSIVSSGLSVQRDRRPQGLRY
ncbi:MAG: hypothetical protein ACREGB_04715, partial [Candidatus Saccharimonadales bacterium]